uniref:Uncharacterized protein n=1 Tax=Chromera velia CCMP2878 TaxID=1169474 RepID=A0A0G4I870_9ALVE|mmetsp:Transcript_33394/g.66220  ORF Transcript_33394/g.66220 Transcript_33394/m.66220 type:complete len:157 (-) Transcript_33394:525-995(-)|eukprot:Cvel_11854.t1-p1 / transcript=Cvel_11854.t1 / gene=Cvel_11854 / organism=Chromera_velia_CCMP2878 / gene_product=hypothetical protein / transcript_product=hypothetical protein / location=Cvel_scaffold756:21378-23256(-) / protein_length=156 / sequence_SO=supercontig / SO=protein_coding / is_pseudo=false
MPVRFADDVEEIPNGEEGKATDENEKLVRMGMVRVGNTYQTIFRLNIPNNADVQIGTPNDDACIVQRDLDAIAEDVGTTEVSAAFKVTYTPSASGRFRVHVPVQIRSDQGRKTVEVAIAGNGMEKGMGKPCLRKDVWEIARAPDAQTDVSDVETAS